MYKIGEFSKLVKVPVKTLRYYDEIGLLQPDEVDEFTGYRYYSENKVKDYQMINLLKSVDFSLNEIIEHKDNLTEEVLLLKMDEMTDRMLLLRHKYNKVKTMRESLKSGKISNNKREKEEILVLRRKYEKRNIGNVA